MARTVTLVNTAGQKIGIADILDAHTGEGKLHKAFSVFIFRTSDGKLLLQQRSREKMLFAGIWANSCCSHPFEEETPAQAGERRLQEELGFTTPLHAAGDFVYRAPDPNGKGIEHEHDTILIGTIDDTVIIRPNPAEVAEYKWVDPMELTEEMNQHPDVYAPWLKIGLAQILAAQ